MHNGEPPAQIQEHKQKTAARTVATESQASTTGAAKLWQETRKTIGCYSMHSHRMLEPRARL